MANTAELSIVSNSNGPGSNGSRRILTGFPGKLDDLD